MITDIDFKFHTSVRTMNEDPIDKKNTLYELIERKEYEVDINVLGLRDLESVGIVPVRKPFIKFSVRSLMPPS